MTMPATRRDQPTTAAFPAAPVRRLLMARAEQESLALTELAQRLQLPRRTLYRVLTRDWLRWDTADRVAVALGCHPFEIWPSWFNCRSPERD